MKLKQTTKISICLAIFLTLTAIINMPSSFAQASSAEKAILSAKVKLIECFNDAKAAETVGANITSLTDKLTAAGVLITQAEQAYVSGNYYGAESLATQSQVELSGLFFTSNSLQDQAFQKQSLDFWVDIVGSLCGAVVVLVGSFVIWILLKHRFVNAMGGT